MRNRTLQLLCRRGNDMLLVLLLFIFACGLGYGHLRSLDTGMSAVGNLDSLYGTAVMMAYGYGFVTPDLKSAPELSAFLYKEREYLTRDELPPTIFEGHSDVANYHRYLLYTVAAIWRITGVSWRSLEPLLAFMLGWSAVALYGLFLLGMRRWVSFLLTGLVIASPAMLFALPDLRDFSKAPFLLTILLGLGWLIKKRPGVTGSSVIACLLGLLTGIAMGFRQDALVFAPLSVAVLVVLGSCRYRPAFSRIILPVFFYIACFIFSAWPMLMRMEGSAGPDHHLIQGFSVKRLDNLAVYSPVFKPVLSGADEYIFTTVYDYGRRVSSPPQEHFQLDSPGAEKAGRALLTDMANHFPADLLVRGYASALRTLRYADAFPPMFLEPTPWHRAIFDAHRAFALKLTWLGPALGITVLLLIAAHNFVLALGLFVFSLYIFGYVSLQAEQRHAFHLSFLIFWVIGFLVERGIVAVQNRRLSPMPYATAIRALPRMFLFALCCMVMLLTPLHILRAYQNYTMRTLLEPYLTAPREVLPTTRQSRHGWTLFVVEETSLSGEQSDVASLCRCIAMLLDMDVRPWHSRARYMVAEFAPDTDISWLILKYGTDNERPNFTQRLHFPRWQRGEAPVQIFFPVYEFIRPDYRDNAYFARNHFTGIALPDGQADNFRGLYEITDLSRCRFLLTLSVAGDNLPDVLYHKILFKPDPLFYYQSERGPLAYTGMAEAAERFGRRDEAVFLLRSLLPMSGDPTIRLSVVTRLAQMGELDAALEGVLDLRAVADKDKESLNNILRWLTVLLIEGRRMEQSETSLEFLEEHNPGGQPELWLELARASIETDPKGVTLARFGNLVRFYPAYEPGITQAEYFLRDNLDHDSQKKFWRRALEHAPGNALLWLQLGKALDGMGDIKEAAQAYATAYENDPNCAEVMLYYAVTHVEALDIDVFAALINTALEHAPNLASLAVLHLERSASNLAASGNYALAAVMYGVAAAYSPEKERLLLLQAEASGADENENLFISLLEGSQRERVAERLDSFYKTHKSLEDRAASWQALLQRYPDNRYVKLYRDTAYGDVAVTLFNNSEYDKAVATFENACAGVCAAPLHEVVRLIAAMIVEQQTDHIETIRQIASQHPPLRQPIYEGLLHGVEALEQEGQLDVAAVLAQTATDILPEPSQAWLTAIRLAHAHNTSGAGEALYRQAIEQASDTAVIAASIDEHFRRLDDAEVRRSAWESLARTFPGNEVVQLHLALAFDAEGNAAEALRRYEALADVFPAHGEMQLRYGGLLAGNGNPDAGIARIANAVEQQPDKTYLASEVCVQAGDVLSQQGNHEDSVRMYEQAVRYTPGDGFITLKLIEALVLGNDYTNALAACEAAHQQTAAPPVLRLIQGALLCNMGRFEESATFFETLPSVDAPAPWITDLLIAAADAATGQGQLNASERILVVIVAVQPDNLWYQVRLGEALAAQERYEEALAHFRRVLAVAPESPHTAAQIDIIYDRLQTPEARVEEWRRLCEIHPESPTLQQHLSSALERDTERITDDRPEIK